MQTPLTLNHVNLECARQICPSDRERPAAAELTVALSAYYWLSMVPMDAQWNVWLYPWTHNAIYLYGFTLFTPVTLVFEVRESCPFTMARTVEIVVFNDKSSSKGLTADNYPRECTVNSSRTCAETWASSVTEPEPLYQSRKFVVPPGDPRGQYFSIVL